MTIDQTYDAATKVAEREDVEALLERFPDISETDTLQIATFIRKGSSLDIGILSTNKSAWDKVELLQATRPDLFRVSAKGWVLFALLALTTVAMLWGLWAIAPR